MSRCYFVAKWIKRKISTSFKFLKNVMQRSETWNINLNIDFYAACDIDAVGK